MEHSEWEQDFDFSHNTGMHHPWADFLDYAPFYWKNPAMHQLYASPFIRIWKRFVGETRFSLSTLSEGITITVLNKNPVRDVEMASPGPSRAWQVIPLQERTSAWWPRALCGHNWDQSPAPLCSLGFSLQTSHLVSLNLTFAPGEVFTRFLFQDYH